MSGFGLAVAMAAVVAVKLVFSLRGCIDFSWVISLGVEDKLLSGCEGNDFTAAFIASFVVCGEILPLKNQIKIVLQLQNDPQSLSKHFLCVGSHVLTSVGVSVSRANRARVRFSDAAETGCFRIQW